MPPLVIDDTVQVTLNWSLLGTPWAVNVLHYKGNLIGDVDQDMANLVDADIRGSYVATGLRPHIGANWSLINIGVRDLRAANLPLFTSAPGNTPGTAAGDSMPPQNAIVVTLRTALAGKSFRGRVYLSGFAEAVNSSNGTILAAARTEAAEFIQGIMHIEDLGHPYDMDLAVASRTLEISTRVTSAIVRDAVWDAQRRRRDGIVSS